MQIVKIVLTILIMQKNLFQKLKLLKIQKEIHPGIFAVTDGTFAGDGPGPRALNWKQKNILIASSDQVAIDAVSATLMGFDPMSIRFIRMAHEAGLGCGDVKELNIEGEDISEINWNFSKSSNTFASWGQKLVYWGPLKPLEKIILNTPLVFLGILASNIFHNFSKNLLKCYIFYYELVYHSLF